MSDYFKDLLDEKPVSRQVKYGKKTQTVFLRRLTAGERLILVMGQKMSFADGKRGVTEVDLGDVTRNRHILVQYSCVTETGDQLFMSLADVQAQPGWLVSQLSDLATDYDNQEDEGPEKS